MKKFATLLIAAAMICACGNNGNNAGNENNSNEAAEDTARLVEQTADTTADNEEERLTETDQAFEEWLNRLAQKLEPRKDIKEASDYGYISKKYAYFTKLDLTIRVDSVRDWMCYDIFLGGDQFRLLGLIFFEKENGSYKLKIAKKWKYGYGDWNGHEYIRERMVGHVWQKNGEPMLVFDNHCAATAEDYTSAWLCDTEGHVFCQWLAESNYDGGSELDMYDDFSIKPEFIYDSLSCGKPYIRLNQHDINIKPDEKGEYTDTTIKDTSFMLKYMPNEDKYIDLGKAYETDYEHVNLDICD